MLGRIRAIAKFLTPKVFSTIFNSFIIPVYDYGIDIWATQTRLELSEAQAPINRLIAAYHYPSLFRKLRRKVQKGDETARRRLYLQQRKLFLVSDVLEQIRILTIPERAEWTMLKNVFLSLSEDPHIGSQNLFTLSSNTRCSRTLPLLTVDACNSETLRKSVKFRSVKVWNSLPKTWDIQNLPTATFKKSVYELLVARRSDQFLKL